MATYCKHCGHGEWNPQMGTRVTNFWISHDETEHGIQVVWGGKVVLDIVAGSIGVRDKQALPLAHELCEWLGVKRYTVDRKSRWV